jgi:hypothetical protein
MALTKDAFRLLAPYLKGAKVLCFGYPDLLVTPVEAADYLGISPADIGLSDYWKAHKTKYACADTKDVFSAAGVRETYIVDAYPTGRGEAHADLNNAQDLFAKDGSGFDLVIDAGTMEHCANIGQVLMNAAYSCAYGGRVFHSPPLSMHNHGFYNVNPTLLFDFYQQNGFVVEHCSAFRAYEPFEQLPFALSATARGRMEPDLALYFMARNDNQGTDLFKWPVQSRYQRKQPA